jgi:hypothetical protein
VLRFGARDRHAHWSTTMTIRTTTLILVLGLAAGCSRSAEQQAAAQQSQAAAQAAQQVAAGTQAAGQAAQQGAQQFAQGMQQVAQGLQQMAAAQGDTVGHEILKGFLPASIGAWTQESSRSEQLTMPFKVSSAQAKYRSGASSLDLQITDASLNQLILAPLSMFLVSGYSETSSDGYKKYAALNGSPGFEEWRKNAREAEVTVVVGNRYVVQATGHDVDNADAVRAALQGLDLARLSSLK